MIHPPASLGASPGSYESFLREVMAEAAKTATPTPARSAVQAAADHLGTSDGEEASSGPFLGK